MDKRQESLGSLKLCRFCLTADDVLLPLYNKTKAPKNSVPFTLKILACIAVEVFPSDRMPKYICQKCKFFMEITYTFKQICRQADEAILQYVQNGSPLNAMPWTAQLNKVFKTCHKPEGNVVKTVVQGGTTVKVMAEECSDSEEGEDDNVYNVKIGDGSEEGKSIKIITTVDKQEHAGAKGRLNSKNFDEGESETGIVHGCWPCDECECTYPLKQLLTLHKMQKHMRAKNEVCGECGGRYLNKYDLEIHQSTTHSKEMPFQCVACSKKFKRLIQLKQHEKNMHSDLPQLRCPHCPASFLSHEELEGHQLKHERNTARPFACFCGKSFPNTHILTRHMSMVHNKKNAYSCQYCPEQLPSLTKLTRHVREHAGEKPYPCKYCDKSFTKSHHYTRHLRHKHTSTTLTATAYSYRCGECSEQFVSQDELMYHSALHATRNLTCPLCQEKFEDVDTVTAHIKSHVNGSEFMCDFCELMFTEKEKLDAHLAKMHEEEMMAVDQETEPDESSMDMDAEEDEEDASLDVKEQNGEMVVEIKKPDEYMLPAQPEDDKGENNQSEDSETYVDLPSTGLEIIPIISKPEAPTTDVSLTKVTETAPPPVVEPKTPQTVESSTAKDSPILRKAEDVKRKAILIQQKSTEKKDKPKVESSTASTGASDKSLRLLEKELQDLKRTNSRTETPKTPARPADSLRNRRTPMFSSTPKNRNTDKKEPLQKPTPEKTIDKKQQPERKAKDVKDPKEKSNNITSKEEKDAKVKEEVRASKEEAKGTKEEIKGSKDEKETKASKDEKETKVSKDEKETKASKEEKETKASKDDKQKEDKKETTKNGASETATTPSEDSSVRRSTRPSKVKDYAKMIRDSSVNSEDDDGTDAEDNEDYTEEEKTPDTSQNRGRGRRIAHKPPPPPPATKPVLQPAKTPETPVIAPRKRGRPRKDANKTEVPTKVKKDESSEESAVKGPVPKDTPKENQPDNAADGTKTPDGSKSEPRPGVIISPSGQTLKKVPIKALPPGVKALPLPSNPARSGGEVTEMQIGKKIVKVQKIVMTKAEVEAMTKKGLLEIKDGTMVLKQGIKLPGSDLAGALKSSLAADIDPNKVTPSQQTEKPAET